MQRSEPLQPDERAALVEDRVEAVDRADVIARREQVTGVQAQAEAVVAAGGLDQRGELGEGAPERAARAGRVLEVQRASVGLRERLGDDLAGTRDRGRDLARERRAGVQDDRVRAERVARPQGARQRGAATSLGGRDPPKRSSGDRPRGSAARRRRLRPSRRGSPQPRRRSTTRGFHARGFWLKIWIARAPRSVPRATAFAGPPAGETWAPISIGRPIGAGRGARASDIDHLVVSGRMRVRFAPSPTGALHVGGARTALYNWLLARARRRDARPAHRRYRPRALDAGERRADPRRAALAGDRLRRGADQPDLAHRSPPGGAAEAARRGPRLSLDRLQGGGRRLQGRARRRARLPRRRPRPRVPCACACPTTARPSSTTSSAATRRSRTAISTTP